MSTSRYFIPTPSCYYTLCMSCNQTQFPLLYDALRAFKSTKWRFETHQFWGASRAPAKWLKAHFTASKTYFVPHYYEIMCMYKILITKIRNFQSCTKMSLWIFFPKYSWWNETNNSITVTFNDKIFVNARIALAFNETCLEKYTGRGGGWSQ